MSTSHCVPNRSRFWRPHQPLATPPGDGRPRTLTLLACTALLFGTPAFAASDPPPPTVPTPLADAPTEDTGGEGRDTMDTGGVVAHALASQPAIEALHTRAEALRREAEATRTDRPDPRVMGTVWVDTFGTMEPGRFRTMLEVSQTLPGRTRRDASAQPALLRAEGAAAEEALVKLAIARDVRLALLAVAQVAHLLEALHRQDAALLDLEALLGATMAVGRGSYSDLLEVAIVREELATRVDRLRGEAAAVHGRLFALTGLETASSLPALGPGSSDPLLRLRSLPSEDALLAASQAHPVFQLADVERRAAAAEHEALQIGRRPVPTVTMGVGSMPMMNDGTGMMVMAGIGLPIPVYGAATAHRQQAAALRADAAASVASAEHVNLDAGIRAAAARHAEALRRLSRTEDALLPLADDVIERLVADIETGRASYAEVLRAVSRREALLTRAVEARFDALVAQVELHALVGVPLEEVEP